MARSELPARVPLALVSALVSAARRASLARSVSQPVVGSAASAMSAA
ncbi:Uncharacterised protein [Mycobacterium tuberculosis]|uniref:Uncharacterized protein n=1 Tax=Mycobacterium tuberculosis TaxID=1773 RepID=A0A0T9APL9_MYCTX|nr:hypothetical protein FJ05194_0456 [Mycobacterium tuberculosis FJ05194]KFC54197.1 hypothetical protein FF22_03399 [Mycobacterium tuberculosis]CEZ71258.1 Uncharacterised protein [Mycobacterium tuberculosis]CFA13374.1 Uncharacterised protein [Mycobacterium tuberculosis]CFB95112.1 Uncharacterised protein [Mycobacterium tuberculosis]